MRLFLLIGLLLWILLWCFPVGLAYLFKKKKLRARLAMIASRGMLFFCRVRVTQVGEMSARRPLLMVSNHLSYLDIPVLASVADVRFVPKKEIARWPFVNLVCKIMDVVYIDRSVGKITEGHRAIGEALAQGEVVALFPEATTGDGKRLLPFKPAFFEAAQAAAVQPVAIAYRSIRGLPIDYGQWPLIAWYGDMLLLPHLWTLLSLGRIDVEVHFLSPIDGAENNRKTLSSQSYSAIEVALAGQG